MLKLIKYSVYLFLLVFSNLVLADLKCDQNTLYNNPQIIMNCYILQHNNQPLYKQPIAQDINADVTIKVFHLTSQNWPMTKPYNDHVEWRHILKIFIPKTVTTTQALLYINGGTQEPKKLADGTLDSNPDANPLPQKLDFSKIAIETHSIVVELEDIPPQYLTFDDVPKIARHEDDIVAYTLRRYLDDPRQNAYWPLYLPMTEAVIQAMNAVQEIVVNHPIEHFAVAGASKRGWVTWLAVLADPKHRINAIIPIVINILDTKKFLEHTYQSYDQNWPHPAFDVYNNNQQKQGVLEKRQSEEFSKLMQIIDPMQYIICDKQACIDDRKRLSIPKYIINASGDDFFVPDSLEYLNHLPGENAVRIVPNQTHYIDMKIVEPALLAYYRMIVSPAEKRPSISASFVKNKLILKTVGKSSSVKLWQATNPKARDFRLNNTHIQYEHKLLTPVYSEGDVQKYELSIDEPSQGWKSYFVEATFKRSNGEDYIVTTPAYIIMGKEKIVN